MSNEEAHRLASEKGVSRRLYALVRGIVSPLFRLYFRMHVSGADCIPREGPAIVAPNHKSFWDSFFIGVCTPRHVRFMAKTELIQARYGRLLVRLGAFPVRRGQADEDALETARVILRQGGLLALFPEGTRIRDPDNLGHPRRGAGRLALESGAPLVPCAITGTEKIFRGGFPVPRRVQVAFSPPIDVSDVAPSPRRFDRFCSASRIAALPLPGFISERRARWHLCGKGSASGGSSADAWCRCVTHKFREARPFYHLEGPPGEPPRITG